MQRFDPEVFAARIAAPMIAAALCGFSPATSAAPPTASANAWDLDVQVTIAGAPILDVNPQNTLNHVDELTDFNESNTFVGIDTGPGALARLTTGTTDVEVQWISGPGMLAVGSLARVNDLSLDAVSALSAPLLSVGADLVQSLSVVVGTCPPVAALGGPLDGVVGEFVFRNGFDVMNLSGSTDVQTPGITVSALDEPILNIPIDPDPNTTISVPGVLTLVLNEQTVTGDGITSRGVATNGLHLSMNVLNVITAEVIVSHTEASITCH